MARSNSVKKRVLSVLLALSLCMPAFPAEATATAGNAGVCPHHTVHTEECGYREAVEGQPCGHEHGDECEYIEDGEGTWCTRVHDEACGYVEAVEAAPCAYECETCNAQAETEGGEAVDPGQEVDPGETVDPEEVIGSDEIMEPGNGDGVSAAKDAVSMSREMLKESLLNRIREGSFDPYASDMTVEEFYALMELFQEGSLPLHIAGAAHKAKSNAAAYADGNGEDPGIEEPGAAVPAEDSDSTIPRKMFLFSGLKKYAGDDKPLEYNNEQNYEGPDKAGKYDYPAGLNPSGYDYLRPPMEWEGVPVDPADKEAKVIVPEINKGNTSVAGDVDQKLFKEYKGYYVRRVMVQNYEATVLGTIRLTDKEGNPYYVYYYLTTSATGDHGVSTAALGEGQKFVVEYVPSEHEMKYVVRMAPEGTDFNDTDVLLTKINDFDDVTNQQVEFIFNETDEITWADYVFGADRSETTVDGYYSFLASVPYGYEMRLYRYVVSEGKVKELTGQDPATGILHNNGYPLGREPVYDSAVEANLVINTDKGPTALTLSDTFVNSAVTEDRTITAVLVKKAKPTFSAQVWVKQSTHAKNRGTSAGIGYDYEGEYNKTIPRNGNFPNIDSADKWDWTTGTSQALNYTMKQETDKTYSWSWTFQTNARDGGYTLDSLSVNGVALTIPFAPRWWAWGNNKTQNDIVNQGTSAVGEVEGKSYTVMEYSNGMIVRLDYLCLFAWNEANQRVYRLTITGARSDVTVTGGNLMMGTGAPEIVAYSLTGVHAGESAGGSQEPAVQIYNGAWNDEKESGILVKTQDIYNADAPEYGGNVRFKLADGYGAPYYYLQDPGGSLILATDGNSPQTSVVTREDGSFDLNEDGTLKINGVIPLLDANGTRLKDGDQERRVSQAGYVYGPDKDGWYYAKVAPFDAENYRIALLTVGAREVKYAVRYMPSYPDDAGKEKDEENKYFKGVQQDASGNCVGIVPVPVDPPTFSHRLGYCHDSFVTDPIFPAEQYDDNDGKYYNTVGASATAIISTTYPSDRYKRYVFVDWVLVDENYQIVTRAKTNEHGEEVKDAEGNQVMEEFHFRGNAITITDINEYAILNGELGGAETDVKVLRLMPTWREIAHPFNYNIELRWVDALGKVHSDRVTSTYQDLTDWKLDNGALTVRVHTNSTDLQNWIALHPTYTFWDDVNNAVDDPGYDPKNPQAGVKGADEKIQAALGKYIPDLLTESRKDQYETVLKALKQRNISGEKGDDFTRLGDYNFQVHEDNGTVVIWLYEDKGGLIFHKTVDPQSYIADEEFYFTVAFDNVDGKAPPDSEYKAYPEFVYDGLGRPRDVLDSDAWLVKFEKGKIVSIIPNDGVATHPESDGITYFTLKSGEGIMLYVPDGTYTVTELGSKSGGTYMVDVNYNGQKDPGPSWVIPSGVLWLKGSETTYQGEPDQSGSDTTTFPDGISQVSTTVKFEVGEHDVVQVITFTNKTTMLNIEKTYLASAEDLANTDFTFEVELSLPEGIEPKKDGDVSYFDMIVYQLADKKVVPDSATRIKLTKVTATGPDGTEDDTSIPWIGRVTLKGGQGAGIVMPMPEKPNAEIGYSVEEQGAYDASNPWQLIKTEGNPNGTISQKTGQQTVKFTNAVKDTGLSIHAQMESENEDDNYKTFQFRVTLGGDGAEKINGTYDGVAFNNGVAEFTLKHGEFKTFIFPAELLEELGIDPNQLTYTVEELDVNTEDFTTTVNGVEGTRIGSQSFIKGQTAQVTFVNTAIAKVADLTISKTVVGEKGDPNIDWVFTVTLTDSEDKPLEDSYSYVGGAGSGTIQNGSGSITLKHGQSITIKDLPIGTKYKVVEEKADQYGYRTTVNGVAGGTAEGELVRGSNAVLKYVNRNPRGGVTISKKVVSLVEDDKKETFTFTITVAPPSGKTWDQVDKDNGWTVDSKPVKYYLIKSTVDANGNSGAKMTEETVVLTKENDVFTGTVELQDGWEAHFDPFPDGLQVNVTEEITKDVEKKYNSSLVVNMTQYYDEPGKKPVVTNGVQAPVIIGDDNLLYTFEFCNSRKPVDLEIQKIVTGNTGDRQEDFTFTVTLTDNEGKPLAESYTYTGPGGADSGTIQSGDSITLKHGQSITIKGLPAGAKYVILENGAENYETTITVGKNALKVIGRTATGVLDDDKTTVTYVNKRTGIIPTNATTELAWLIPVLLACSAGFIWFFGRKRGRKYRRRRRI